MRSVAHLAETVPRTNTRDENAAHTAQRVRSRFRAIVSMVGLPVVFDAQGQVGVLVLVFVAQSFLRQVHGAFVVVVVAVVVAVVVPFRMELIDRSVRELDLVSSFHDLSFSFSPLKR